MAPCTRGVCSSLSWGRPRRRRPVLVGRQPARLVLAVVRPVGEAPPVGLVGVGDPDDVARPHDPGRVLDGPAVGGVLHAEGERPVHVARRAGCRSPCPRAPAAPAALVGLDQAQVQAALLEAGCRSARPPRCRNCCAGVAGQPGHRPAPALPLVQLAQGEVDVLLGGQVDPGHHGGLDLEAAFVEHLVAVALADVAAHVLGEVGRALAEEVGRRAQDQRPAAPARLVLGADVAGGGHGGQHLVAPVLGPLQVGGGGEPAGRAGDARRWWPSRPGPARRPSCRSSGAPRRPRRRRSAPGRSGSGRG